MSISAVVPVPPTVASLEAQFAALSPPSSSLPAPSDPFAVLLDAATSPSTDATTSTETPSAPGELVSLASSISPAASQTAGTTTSGSAIVSQASQYLGVPYEWGGSTPSGFDCSGLVQYVFGQLGVDLPRTAAEQEQVGTPVASLAQAQPGDLLFFEPGQNGAPPGQAGHVGIYIGNGQMIDAPETGENVMIQQVPGTPLAIRQITVGDGGPAASATGNTGVAMGNVSVPGQYAGLIAQAATSSGTPAPLLAAILDNESGFDPGAVSSAGAEGIAQIMPATASADGIDPFDPTSAIPGAADLLSGYHAAFGSWTDAIAAYAAGGEAVQAAGGVPQDGSTPSYVATTLALAGMTPGS